MPRKSKVAIAKTQGSLPIKGIFSRIRGYIKRGKVVRVVDERNSIAILGIPVDAETEHLTNKKFKPGIGVGSGYLTFKDPVTGERVGACGVCYFERHIVEEDKV